MKYLILFIALLFTSLSFALDDGHYFTKIGAGSTFEAEVDITIPARTSEIPFNSLSDETKCYLQIDTSQKERVIRAGKEFVVSHAEEGIYPLDFTNTLVFSDSPQNIKLQCLGRSFSGNRATARFGNMKAALSGIMKFTAAEPEEI